MLHNSKIIFPTLSIRIYYFIFCILSIVVGCTVFLLVKQNASDLFLYNLLTINTTILKNKTYPQHIFQLNKNSNQLFSEKNLFRNNQNVPNLLYSNTIHKFTEKNDTKDTFNLLLLCSIFFFAIPYIIFYLFVIYPFINLCHTIEYLYSKNSNKKIFKTTIFEFKKIISIVQKNIIKQQELYHKLQITKTEKKYIQRINSIDYTTGLLDKKCINTYLSKYLGYSVLTILMIDIDHFKAYNDTFGHVAGDKCLAAVARCIKNALKRKEDIVFRYGGEEFIALLPNTAISGAHIVAQRIHNSLTQMKIPNTTSTVYPFLTVSIGINEVLPYKHTTPIDAVHHADIALYTAKHNGRSQTAVHSN
ncbi:GGDEF domain-containing protein [Lawsonia intracellularis]|uniref:diguanylate cyclase n=1 Tax=Lawsonia intracellularis (strain PHE/MN1-00) TaxID=363253 RepID=Q1MQR9_LAWIP|nr:GGDEF domain-containing protein [Lawsonia intracellularis]AGC50021.1 diguanylate cyclase (GGDEF) domain-containing protein [Lawsonia intracellularis N343]KAA0204718.1 GGDEF domain-containing protein [Lawsonia intracellularis]MBZ3893085.1 GGDEF domain-containing protein [Lawsonia intracellularis]OMQ04456.1 GGDEF domain-containing protein [Lawsonia intracellularis]RBN33369.1 GGDEF domain-containing protein [Lawsonia intracellularis]